MISALTPLAFFSSARSSSGWRLPGMRFYRFVDPCPDVPCICMSTTTHDRVQSIDREAYRWDRASLFFECSPPARGEHRETSEPANNKTRPFRHLLHPFSTPFSLDRDRLRVRFVRRGGVKKSQDLEFFFSFSSWRIDDGYKEFLNAKGMKLS